MFLQLHLLLFGSVMFLGRITECRFVRKVPDDVNSMPYTGTLEQRREATQHTITQAIHADPTAGKTTAKLHKRQQNTWRDEILKSVTEIAIPSRIYPSSLLVWGDQTEIIAAEAKGVFIAASEWGNGRVITYSYDCGPKHFTSKTELNGVLLNNIKMWLTKGTYTSDSEICDASELGDLDSIPVTCKILAWLGRDDASDAFYSNMEAWIKKGGGLVCGYEAWYYKVNIGHIVDMPLNKIINKLGISSLYRHFSSGEVYPVGAVMAEYVSTWHFGKQIASCMANESKVAECQDLMIDYVFKSDTLPMLAFEGLISAFTTLIEHYASTTNTIPTSANPVNTKLGRDLVDMMNKIYIRTGQYNGQSKAPGIKHYPGDFDTPPATQTGTFTASFNGTSNKVFPSPYYVPAGQELVISWTNAPSTKWQAIVGAYSDTLYGGRRSSYKRWPRLYFEVDLVKSPIRIKTPFGGPIYLWSPSDTTETLTVTLENVVERPLFIVSESGDWETIRSKPGLWADIQGENVLLTMPASSIRNWPNPTKVMNDWDKVVQIEYDLLTYDKYGGRGEWVFTNLQTSHGYYHAGYPISAPSDMYDNATSNFLLSDDFLTDNGTWGIFHEIGHNLQEWAWTLEGGIEVSCNIFTLYAKLKFQGIEPWKAAFNWIGDIGIFKTYFDNGAKYEDLIDSSKIPLAVYVTLIRDFGFDSFKSVFKEYHGLENPKTNEDEIDQWITRFSKTVGKNLCPFYDFYGYVIRPGVQEALKDLPPFLPADKFNKEIIAPERFQSMMEKYGVTSLGATP